MCSSDLFGAGWSIAGTCPAPALAMLSSGATYGAVAVVGLFVDLWLRDRQVAAGTGGASIGDGEHRDLRTTPAGSA